MAAGPAVSRKTLCRTLAQGHAPPRLAFPSNLLEPGKKHRAVDQLKLRRNKFTHEGGEQEDANRASFHPQRRPQVGDAAQVVNITAGLPAMRTSVNHGTAFDITDKGIADDGSLLEALRQAIDPAPARA